MSIKVKAIARKNPRDLTAPPKYYASKVNSGEVTLETISFHIAQMSTVSKTDVMAVLTALTEVIPKQLEYSKIIRLGKLGSFNIGVHSDPSDTIEEVSSSSVNRLKITFRPSIELNRDVVAFPVTKVTE